MYSLAIYNTHETGPFDKRYKVEVSCNSIINFINSEFTAGITHTYLLRIIIIRSLSTIGAHFSWVSGEKHIQSSDLEQE